MASNNQQMLMEFSTYQAGMTELRPVATFMASDSPTIGNAPWVYTELRRVPGLPSIGTIYQSTMSMNGQRRFERRSRNPVANHANLPSVESVAQRDATYLDAHTPDEVQQVLSELLRRITPEIHDEIIRDVLSRFNVGGFELERMGREQFCERHPLYGPLLYHEYQTLKSDFQHPGNLEEHTDEFCMIGEQVYTYDSEDRFDDIDEYILQDLKNIESKNTTSAISNTGMSVSEQFPRNSQNIDHGKLPATNGNLPRLTKILGGADEWTDTDFDGMKQCSITSPDDSGFYTENNPEEYEAIASSPQQEQSPVSEMMDESNDSMIDAFTESPSSDSAMACSSPEGSAVGRPVKKKGGRGRPTKEKGNHLWEFLLEVLHTEIDNPTFLRWENRELGIFRILKSKGLSDLWGVKKNNPKMTYEKLSRALRDYTRVGIRKMTPIHGRLLFQFGPEIPWSEYCNEVEARMYRLGSFMGDANVVQGF